MKLSSVDLRMFAAIADLGSISAAARHIGRQKSTVSRDLAILEERLGTRLVQRTTRRLSFTDAGELLAAHARRVVEELEHAEAAIEALSDEPRGALLVTAPSAIVRFVMTPHLAAFQARYPEIRLSIDPTIRVVDIVEEGVDVAIRIGDLPSSSFVARTLARVPLILAASPAYVRAHGAPATPQSLIEHSLVDLRPQSNAQSWRLADKTGAESEVAVAPHLAIADPGIVLDCLMQGVGIGIVPKIYANAALASGAMVHILPDYTLGIRAIHALYPSRRLLAPKVRVFVDFMGEILGTFAT